MTDPADRAETLPDAEATVGWQADPAASPPDPPGEAANGDQPRMLGGRYLLEEWIASGGMASVWRAHDEVLARTVAVKVLHDHLAEDGDFRERFRREAVTAARLAHPNVVSLYDTGADGDRVYLVMELVDGFTLRDVIADVGSLEIGQVAAIGEKVARALHYAHTRGLVHRDVKPANILIGEDGMVKVTDFGIAKADQDQRDLTRTGMVLGTAAYVAPEQVLAKPLDGKADQYALGCVLYEALTGRRPFMGDSPIATAAARLERDPLPLRSLRADIPRGLEQVVTRCIARDPMHRYSSCSQLADALTQFVDVDTEAVGLLAATERNERTEALPRAAVSPAEDTGGSESFLRSEGRWLAPVLALLLLAGALVGVGLATGVLQAGDGLIPRFARDVTESAGGAAGTAMPLKIVGASSFDPQADGEENESQVRAVYDADPRSAWRTDGYNTVEFGGLKSGVGFYVDLGASRAITAATLTTTTPGINYELRVADAPVEDVDGWRLVGTVTDARADAPPVKLDESARGRYLLVWVRGDLQRQGGRFYAGFSRIALEGNSLQ
ncbi:MAG: protein kinase domain-containing protein [Egibacteraceae bacterium]